MILGSNKKIVRNKPTKTKILFKTTNPLTKAAMKNVAAKPLLQNQVNKKIKILTHKINIRLPT